MPSPAIPDTYRGFFDDAATFPPGRAPLEDAVRAYLERRPTPLDAVVGPMVLPVADLPATAELLAQIAPEAAPFPVSAVVPIGGLADARRTVAELDARINVTAFELKTAGDDDLSAFIKELGRVVADCIGVWLELVAEQVDDDSLTLMRERGVGLKFRTGGLTADLFPSAHTLAEVIRGAARAGVRFKLTAGLHEAIRFTSTETGLDHHGFLNIAAATAAARTGADTAAVAELLGSTDAAELTSLTRDGAWRRSFNSFGTCSIREPVESLQRLGLLDPRLLPAA